MGRKRWLAVIFTVVLAAQAILAGCGNDGASKGGKTEGGEAKTEQAEDGQETDGKTEDQKAGSTDTVELRFHDIIPNPAREAKFKEMVERFNEENPGIKVTYESTPWDQSHNKLVTQGSADTMPDAGQNRYGFAFRGARGGADQMGMYLLGALNGRLYEEDGTCRINTPEGLEAFQKYCSLYLDGYATKDSINWGYAEMVQGFTSGLSGILNQTTEVTQTCKETMQDEEWTVIPFPRSADGNIYSKADSFFYTITKSSQHPEEAWKFVSFMMSPENNMEYCETNLYIPVMQGAENDPRFTEGGMEGFVASMNDEYFVRNPFYGYFPELTEFAETVYDAELQKYLLGQQTAEEAVAHISDFLTEAQQRFMESSPDTPLPRAVKVDGTEIK